MKWLESKNLMLITSSVAVLVIMFSIHTVIASPTQAPPNGNPTFPLQGNSGINCWDIDGDGINDPSEDTDSNGQFNALDCQGEDGVDGINGTNGADGVGISNCTLKTCDTGDWGLCTCDAGKQIFGGGCYNTGGGSIIQADRPVNTTTWQCGGGGFNKQISIICCNIG